MIPLLFWWRAEKVRVLIVLEALVVILAVFGVGMIVWRTLGPEFSRLRPPALVGGTIDLRKLSEGLHTVTVRVGDDARGRAEATVAVWVSRDAGDFEVADAPRRPPRVGPDAADPTPLADDPILRDAVTVVGPVKTRQAEDDPRLTGNASYSGAVSDGSRPILVLARSDVAASYFVSLPPSLRYLVELHARHDVPAPVSVDLSLNGRLWKRLLLAQGDGAYHTTRVGILRNFSSGVVGLRLGNDAYAADRLPSCGSDAACLDEVDRNLYVDWVRFIPIE